MPPDVVERPVGLSIFFPAYNDSGTIASLVIAARRTAQQLTADFEIIIVNDGSADNTREIAEELAVAGLWVQLVVRRRHRLVARLDRAAELGRRRS